MPYRYMWHSVWRFLYWYSLGANLQLLNRPFHVIRSSKIIALYQLANLNLHRYHDHWLAYPSNYQSPSTEFRGKFEVSIEYIFNGAAFLDMAAKFLLIPMLHMKESEFHIEVVSIHNSNVRSLVESMQGQLLGPMQFLWQRGYNLKVFVAALLPLAFISCTDPPFPSYPAPFLKIEGMRFF